MAVREGVFNYFFDIQLFGEGWGGGSVFLSYPGGGAGGNFASPEVSGPEDAPEASAGDFKQFKLSIFKL